MKLRLPSTLPDDVEDLVQRTIGCLITVHRELGSGMNEGVYAAATQIELSEHRIRFEAEKLLPVRYHGHLVGEHRVDLLVEDRLVVELKTVERLHPTHISQVVTYLRLTGVSIGLLVNFNVPFLREGLRRIVV
jgi:GxxExxY protein